MRTKMETILLLRMPSVFNPANCGRMSAIEGIEPRLVESRRLARMLPMDTSVSLYTENPDGLAFDLYLDDIHTSEARSQGPW